MTARKEAAPPAPESGLTRREVLRSGMMASVGAFFATALGGAGGFVWPVKVEGFGGLVQAPNKLSEIQVGDVIPVRAGKYYLTRTEDGLMALYWKCVHLGCTVPYDKAAGRFICPCHKSTYDLTGLNLAGPAPRPLDYMEITVEGERIVVDTGKIHTRTRYEPSQALKV